jgi:hypothetical protein
VSDVEAPPRPEAPKPYLHQPGTRLYLGDTREILPLLDAEALPPIAVVLMDPPYAAWRYITETIASHNLSLDHDGLWQREIFGWVGQWFPTLRQRVTEDAVGWLFCNLHYLGFYLRWASFCGWPVRGIFGLQQDEFLLHLGAQPLSALAAQHVSEALQKNEYGQDKNLAMLDVLLLRSPAGAVIDPFCGGGHTLLAARRQRRVSVGIEIDPVACERAAERLRL